MSKKILHGKVVIALALLLWSLTAQMNSQAEQTTVAVASNFMQPMKIITQVFEKKSGHQVQLVFGSSGKLFAQIQNNAPFDLFLSADISKPLALIKNNLALKDTQFTYAIGSLLLWSADPQINTEDWLKQGLYNKLAIPNPRLAPYGMAAMEVLAKLELETEAKPRLVMGENIAQTYQFVASGNAQIGFIAMSQVIHNGKLAAGGAWIVPDKMYTAIKQNLVLLNRGANNKASRELLGFLKSSEAKTIIQDYGYQ